MTTSDVCKPKSAHVIALDVGGTSIKSAVIARHDGILREPVVTPIDSTADKETILATFVRIVQNHWTELEGPQFRGIALGIPGHFDYAKGICRIAGLDKYEGLYGINLREALQTRLGRRDLPILFRNDAEAAVVGEARYGAGRQCRRLIGVTLGTGFGSAFIEDGKIPLTLTPGIPRNGWLYPELFHNRQADDVFSSRGLEAQLRASGASRIDVEDATVAARLGDPAARRVLVKFGSDLGEFLNPYAITFHAEAVLVLGRIAGAFDLFGPPLQQALAVPALIGECADKAALLGAADLFSILNGSELQ